MNFSISALHVSSQNVSPFFSMKHKISLNKARFLNQISPVFSRFSPISIKSSQFKNFATSVVRLESEQKLITGVFTERFEFTKSENQINFTDAVFVSISDESNGGAIRIARESNTPEFEVFFNRVKFYNCSALSAPAFYLDKCPLKMEKVCITHCKSKSTSAFSISTCSKLQINSSFVRQSSAEKTGSAAALIESDDLVINNINLTMPNDITHEPAEAALSITFDKERVSYVSIDQWLAPNICHFTVKQTQLSDSYISNFNFHNVTATSALIGVAGKITIAHFTHSGVFNITKAFYDASQNEDHSEINVQDSMFDESDVDTSFVTLDNAKYNRSMTFISVNVGYGPGCYNTPPPTKPKNSNYTSYFIGIAGFLLVVVIGIIAYTVVFVVKKPRAVDESTAMQQYQMIDKFGETRITA